MQPHNLGNQPSLKSRALRFLAAREYSRFELEQKLKPHEAQEGELSATLDELTHKGLLSDARVLESTLHQKAGKLGAARVLHVLKAKGIGAELLMETAEQLKASEFDRAWDVWSRKFGAHPVTTPQDYAKQTRFLAARGFSGEIIGRVLRATKQKD